LINTIFKNDDIAKGKFMENVKIIELGVIFDGSNEDGVSQYPSALGVAKYKGVEFNFEINEQHCMSGFPVENFKEVFVAWVHNGESFSNPTPAWANEDDEWEDEVEEAIDKTEEVIAMKRELISLTVQNCHKENVTSL
jgi:hypothetical protein